MRLISTPLMMTHTRFSIPVCKADHKNTSCVAITILTHGERGGEVCAADRPYPVNDIMAMIQRAPGLAGKPKLLFVQVNHKNNQE